LTWYFAIKHIVFAFVFAPISDGKLCLEFRHPPLSVHAAMASLMLFSANLQQRKKKFRFCECRRKAVSFRTGNL